MKREVNRSVLNEGIAVAVLGHVHMDPTQSISKISKSSGTSRFRISKTSKFHPDIMKQVQQSNKDGQGRHLQFGELFTQQLIDNENLLYNTPFSDICKFMVNGEPLITVVIEEISVSIFLRNFTHNTLKNSMHVPKFWETVFLDHFSLMTI